MPAGDEQVGMAVVVDVADGHAVAVAPRERREPRRRRRILECPIAPIAKEAVPFGPGAVEVGREGPGLRQVDVEPAVTVVVEQPDAAGRGLGHVADGDTPLSKVKRSPAASGVVHELGSPDGRGGPPSRAGLARGMASSSAIKSLIIGRRRAPGFGRLQPLQRLAAGAIVRVVLARPATRAPGPRSSGRAPRPSARPRGWSRPRFWTTAWYRYLISISSARRVASAVGLLATAASSSARIGQPFQRPAGRPARGRPLLMRLPLASRRPRGRRTRPGGRAPPTGRAGRAGDAARPARPPASSWHANGPVEPRPPDGRVVGPALPGTSPATSSPRRAGPARVARFAQPSQTRSSSGAFRAASSRAARTISKPHRVVRAELLQLPEQGRLVGVRAPRPRATAPASSNRPWILYMLTSVSRASTAWGPAAAGGQEQRLGIGEAVVAQHQPGAVASPRAGRMANRPGPATRPPRPPRGGPAEFARAEQELGLAVPGPTQ